jgi:hypothetical protein
MVGADARGLIRLLAIPDSLYEASGMLNRREVQSTQIAPVDLPFTILA